MIEKRALIVEGDAVSLTVMSKMFSAEGYAVQLAKSGREALQRLAGTSFHVIASRHETTPISGMDLWKLVRNEPRHEAALFLLVATAVAHCLLDGAPQPARVERLVEEDGKDRMRGH